MIITCPHCQTQYQVTYEAIGSAGRKVQCAHCQQAWQQPPLDGFDTPPTRAERQASQDIKEDALDELIEDEERAVLAEVARKAELEKAAEEAQHRAAAAAAAASSNNKTDAATQRKRQKAFNRRQTAMAADLPLARLRRVLRLVGAALLIGVVATAYLGRVAVVERFPAMAGVYEAVGLGVNVVGLDFSNVTTMQSLRDGKETLAVSAQIVGLMPEPVPVPAVVVTLLDSRGQGIYEWSVLPSVRDLMAGERSTFDTQLTMPPGDATNVRLSFGAVQNKLGDASAQGVEAAEAEAEAAGEHGPVEDAPVAEDHAAPADEHAAPAEEHAAPAAEVEHTPPEHH